MRGVPRWLAVVAVLTIAAVVCAFTVHRALTPATFVLRLSQPALPADGFSSSELRIESADGRPVEGIHVEIETPHEVTLESLTINSGFASVLMQSGVLPGTARIRLTAPGFVERKITLAIFADYNDSVGDGTPDFLRLHDGADRQAFRRWFTLLAESQFYRPEPLPEIDDCAALLRFSYREAMRRHDAAWAHTVALPVPPSSGDVQQYQYPYTPLAAAVFRVKEGSFQAADLHDGAFSQFADAQTLWRHNTFSVGRNLRLARPGDLLFFRQAGAHMPFHAMIFLGRSQVEPARVRAESGPTADSEPGAGQYVVYDTGPSGTSKGIIKRLSVAELMSYPDPRWRPVASNPAFLGVYRWNILRGGQ